MKTIKLVYIFGVIMSLMPAEAKNISVSDDLINAIMIVESQKQADAIGDNGKAIGCAQIHKVCVDDVNRILCKKVYTYEDRKSPEKSKEIMKIYLSYYGARYEKLTGKKATAEVLAKIWNGGPNGWKKEATITYARKVLKRLYV